ncbi:DUF885 domain-containing protein [Psychrosphaera sp. 1_MG-2023]|uniref:DUF885 domain-containing protein n=1 Tax=Psychrosphaera sp. 1_MG-2023 TaxID=3062643 RepID=UPI0026E1F3B7|nr:DUF885 domain-containing protein [Psychrosphaera sp. 1_MG-2023]MDO6719270.1 DUF885 domain-containing protein [Psychrosphaera sp. 1_MG-2023]
MINLVNVKNLTKVAMMCATVGLVGCNAVGLGGTASEVKSAVAQLPDSTEQLDKAFAQYSEAFIERFWQLNPTYAVYVGYYKYDDSLPVPNKLKMAKELNVYRAELKALEQFNVDKLSPRYASDYYILKNQLESYIWWYESLKADTWDPSNYNVAGGFGVILNTDYKPLNDRLKTIIKRMENIPAYYEAAINNLTSPTVTHTELAIQQNKGALGLFEGAIKDQVHGSELSAQDKADFDLALQKTTTAINGYIQHLEQLLPKLKADPKTRDFRIGKKLYDKKFELDIFSGYTAKQLFDKAVSEKSRVHKEMAKIADTLWPKYFPNKTAPSDSLIKIKTLIDHISVKHVKRDEFVSSIREQIPELEAFVMEHNLITMDKDKPLVVRETPKYQRGFAGASINAPGPYDAEANTYYNVTPLDNMDDEGAESYLREYNHWLLQVLNIHEAVPGHYTQLVHSNKSKSLVKAIFGNGAMVEGWAVYTERMMLEEGYGDFEPELWLMYYKWNLRVIMNSILDYSIQVLGIDEKQAMDMMVNQAFQEPAEAQGKWRRATLSQVQLTSYFTGYSEIYQLREELKEATGDKFSLVDFHNQFLSYGSAPVPIIRKLMFDDYVASHK